MLPIDFCGNINPLVWRHNKPDGVSKHQPHDCLLNRLFRRRLKKTSKLRATGLCEGTSTVTGEFLAQMTSNAENVSIWWRNQALSDNYTGGFTESSFLLRQRRVIALHNLMRAYSPALGDSNTSQTLKWVLWTENIFTNLIAKLCINRK